LSYTLSGRQYVTEETRVDVPSGYLLALSGFRPNPAIQSLIVSFSLPTADPATLELLDVTGDASGLGRLGLKERATTCSISEESDLWLQGSIGSV
jgi:hypothetical protein